MNEFLIFFPGVKLDPICLSKKAQNIINISTKNFEKNKIIQKFIYKLI